MLELLFPGFFLGVVLAVCVFTDALRGKVYNIVTIPAMVFGIAGSTLMYGLHGFLGGMGGLLLGGVLLFVPFAVGVLGAGDVKLSAAVGSIAGPWFVLQTILVAFLFAAIATILIRLYQGRLSQTLKRTGLFFWGLVSPLHRTDMSRTSEEQGIPFALCLAAGALVVKWWNGNLF
ncbi:A24 family peptidase [Desulfonatronum thiodismutans]|uniref:A24 family peptidase n=1 Tax=Desulfonatronum thiodismutans TaxID=159290 RepID=UPI0006920894|nr:A24 family peptidase [Desulfonatronum thiodismutans]